MSSYKYSASMMEEIEPHLSAIQQFRDLLSDYFILHSEERIVVEAVKETRAVWRWLKACDFKIKAATDKFILAADYRRLHALDSILERCALPSSSTSSIDAIAMRQLSQDTWHSYDNEGCPIFIERYGLIDANLSKKFTLEQRIHYHHLISEFTHQVLLPRASKRAGHLIDRVTSIFDMTSFALSSINAYNRSFVSSVIEINSKLYPEIMNRTIIIHVPMAFSFAWTLVKNLIDANTRSKICIASSLKGEQWTKYASLTSMPTFLGGSHQCNANCEFGGCMSHSEEVALFESIVKGELTPSSILSASITPVSPPASTIFSISTPTTYDISMTRNLQDDDSPHVIESRRHSDSETNTYSTLESISLSEQHRDQLVEAL